MMLKKERAVQAALETSNTTPDIEHCCPAYNQENFLTALIQFIITDNKVSTPLQVNCTRLIILKLLNVIECLKFWDLLLLLRKELKNTEILHRCKICDLILHQWSTYFKHLRKDLEVHPFPSSALLLITL